jgi:short-subunit dehydrogenase
MVESPGAGATKNNATLQGKAVLLTGASSGIGREAARLLAARGARLALVARREERLRGLAAELAAEGGDQPVVLAADLAQRGVAADLAAQAMAKLGRIDVLVNNAGASIQALGWVGGDRDEARAVFETNVWIPLALVAAVAPEMVARGHGVIVNTGSMVQVSPFPHLGHYTASRAALALMTQTLRLELEPRGVRVVEVALGPVDTAASTENRLLKGGAGWLEGWPGLGRLEDAAEALVAAIEGSVSGVIIYPRILNLVYALPALGRRHARRVAKQTDLTDTSLRVGGSSGSPEIQEARERFEAGRTVGAR